MSGPDQPRDTWLQRRSSFGAVAPDYARLRPGYPADAVGFLLGPAPVQVLDARCHRLTLRR